MLPSIAGARGGYRADAPTRAAGFGCFLSYPAGSGDGSAEVFAGGDGEFGEHVAQMPLDGTGADVQLGGDLLIGVPVPGELGDLGLLSGEVSKGLHGAFAHCFPGGQQFAAGAVGEAFHAHRGQHLVGGAKLFAGVDAAIFAAEPFSGEQMPAGPVRTPSESGEPPDRPSVLTG